MAPRIYTEVISVGDVNVYHVDSNPNGSLAAPRGSLAIRNDNLGTYQNIDGASGWSVLSAGAVTFIYRPSDPAPSINVFTTTAELRAAVNATPGPKIIRFDARLAPVTLDAGLYGDEDTVYAGPSLATNTNVTVEDGALLPGNTYNDNIKILWTGTTPVGSPPEGGVTLIRFGSELRRLPAAGGPYMNTALVTTGCVFVFERGGSLRDDSGPVIDIGPGLGCQFIGLELCNIEANTISADATSLVILGKVSDSANIDPTQPAVAGTLFSLIFPDPTNTTFSAFPLTLSNNELIVTVDMTGGPGTIFLPPAAVTASGHTVVFAKFDATGTVATIDGNGTPINGVATQPLSLQYSTLTVQLHRNGVGGAEWIII